MGVQQLYGRYLQRDILDSSGSGHLAVAFAFPHCRCCIRFDERSGVPSAVESSIFGRGSEYLYRECFNRDHLRLVGLPLLPDRLRACCHPGTVVKGLNFRRTQLKRRLIAFGMKSACKCPPIRRFLAR